MSRHRTFWIALVTGLWVWGSCASTDISAQTAGVGQRPSGKSRLAAVAPQDPAMQPASEALWPPCRTFRRRMSPANWPAEARKRGRITHTAGVGGQRAIIREMSVEETRR